MRCSSPFLSFIALALFASSVAQASSPDAATIVETWRVSVAGNEANDNSRYGALSADGSTVVYQSGASNLVPNDTNGLIDVFSYDVATGVITRVSVDSGGGQANGISHSPSVSADGGLIVYESQASNLVVGDTNGFTDIFAFNVATGVTTKGCNPPVNDMFCPHDYVTRGQMAAFLVRALDLTDPGVVDFVDDDTSIFEAHIEKLAAAGITKGCNPPVNDMFCPHDYVTRGQMAAFLHRALG